MFPKVIHPNKSQAEIIRRHGFVPFVYAVLDEDQDSITVVHRIQGIVRNLKKEGNHDEE